MSACPPERHILLINGSEQPYLNIHFTKNHPSPDPDTFDITLSPTVGSTINFFDTIEIQKLSRITPDTYITEFYGFVEEISPEVGDNGLEYYISGRCWKLITWKKYNERYQESREKGPESESGEVETGFFGEVRPSELVKFLLWAPTSIHPKGYIRHKIGWGTPSDVWDCCANVTAATYYPEWVGLRYTGLTWRGRGNYSEWSSEDLNVDGIVNITLDWNEYGVSPYLNSSHATDSSSYIDAYTSMAPAGDGIGIVEEYFTFQNLADEFAVVPTIITSVKLYVECKKDCCNDIIRIYIYDGADWHGPLEADCPWHSIGYVWFEIVDILDTPWKVDNARIKFVTYHERLFCRGYIWHVYLHVTGGSGADTAQAIDDYFIVDLGQQYDRVAGILVESREHVDMYPRAYRIQFALSNCCSYGVPESDEWEDFSPKVEEWWNQSRDVLHSWTPQDDVRCIRIQILSSCNAPWEISQIYVWQADEERYKMMDEDYREFWSG